MKPGTDSCKAQFRNETRGPEMLPQRELGETTAEPQHVSALCRSTRKLKALLPPREARPISQAKLPRVSRPSTDKDSSSILATSRQNFCTSAFAPFLSARRSKCHTQPLSRAALTLHPQGSVLRSPYVRPAFRKHL